MKRLDGIKAWVGDVEGAVRGLMSFPLFKQRLHQDGIRCLVEIEVYDKFGKLISQREQTMESFNKDFWYIMQQVLSFPCTVAPKLDILDTSNAEVWAPMSALDALGDWCDLGAAGVDLYGILIGSSATAWAWAQYDLQGKIAHGSGAGQLSYGVTTATASQDSGLPAKITSQRSFDNNSGSDVTVREIGWFGKMVVDSTPHYHMIARDVITATTVPNGGRLTVKYTIQINPT